MLSPNTPTFKSPPRVFTSPMLRGCQTSSLKRPASFRRRFGGKLVPGLCQVAPRRADVWQTCHHTFATPKHVWCPQSTRWDPKIQKTTETLCGNIVPVPGARVCGTSFHELLPRLGGSLVPNWCPGGAVGACMRAFSFTRMPCCTLSARACKTCSCSLES